MTLIQPQIKKSDKKFWIVQASFYSYFCLHDTYFQMNNNIKTIYVRKTVFSFAVNVSYFILAIQVLRTESRSLVLSLSLSPHIAGYSISRMYYQKLMVDTNGFPRNTLKSYKTTYNLQHICIQLDGQTYARNIPYI